MRASERRRRRKARRLIARAYAYALAPTIHILMTFVRCNLSIWAIAARMEE